MDVRNCCLHPDLKNLPPVSGSITRLKKSTVWISEVIISSGAGRTYRHRDRQYDLGKLLTFSRLHLRSFNKYSTHRSLSVLPSSSFTKRKRHCDTRDPKYLIIGVTYYVYCVHVCLDIRERLYTYVHYVCVCMLTTGCVCTLVDANIMNIADQCCVS